MNILFLTIGKLDDIRESGIYTDLLREFKNQGHTVYAVSANQKRNGQETSFSQEYGVNILRVRTGNITKCGLIEKGISTLKIEGQYVRAIKKYLSNVKFDLVLYSTPPITFAKVVKFIKKRDDARSYLLLKDIFPQNAVDIGVLKKSGLKGILYRFFRKKEKKLYALSDKIGCMSPANARYVLEHNPEVNPDKVEVCPNCIEYVDMSVTQEEKIAIRNKYGVPLDKKVFVYGGNLGRPQGIPFIIKCLKTKNNKDAFFLIVGAGTEYEKLENFVNTEKPENVMLLKRLPKEDYDKLAAACDVGMIFLDHRFTIPNFPSRLLSYMQAGLPILACTDSNTDIGIVIEEGGFGWWCESNDILAFEQRVLQAMELSDAEYVEKQEKAKTYLKEKYSIENAYYTLIGSEKQ